MRFPNSHYIESVGFELLCCQASTPNPSYNSIRHAYLQSVLVSLKKNTSLLLFKRLINSGFWLAQLVKFLIVV